MAQKYDAAETVLLGTASFTALLIVFAFLGI